MKEGQGTAYAFAGMLATIIANENMTWEQKYNRVFSKSFSRLIYNRFPDFDHYDPDTSHEEDVLAFAKQFIEYVENKFPL